MHDNCKVVVSSLSGHRYSFMPANIQKHSCYLGKFVLIVIKVYNLFSGEHQH